LFVSDFPSGSNLKACCSCPPDSSGGFLFPQ
jgi:hypothetical protein